MKKTEEQRTEEEKQMLYNYEILQTETDEKFFSRIIPVCILAIVFCFIKWTPINSFGMITFWGIVIIAIYNATITNLLFRIKNK